MTGHISLNVTYTMSGSGDGPTAADLRAFLVGLPDETAISIRSYSDQREGSSWVVSADAAPAQPNFNGIYAPGTR